MTNILEGRSYYKPFRYPQLFELVDKHEKMHWIADEIKLDDDIRHWHDKLGDNERRLLTELFRFFVGADNDVLDGYANLTYYFQKTPEAAMLLASIGAREAVHLMSYSLLIDTVGMPENIYKSFLEYEEIADKHDYVHEAFDALKQSKSSMDTKEFFASTNMSLALAQIIYNSEKAFYENLAKVVCITGCFIEGLQLFSSFAVLKNFEHAYKCMPGMNDIVDFSIRDEDIHIQTCAELYKIMKQEFSDIVDFTALEVEIKEICKHMVELENRFIDMMFDAANNDIKGLTKDELKQFIVALANGRLGQFGIDPVYPPTRNPLTWLDFLIYSKGHTNFFERRATEYGKGTMTGTLTDDAFTL
jgi:ribonucleoside-diphosphate reductase beta chain